eukprot:COSAG01_NODE_28649_length_656_cov_1.075404_1_plen_123_part_00
MGHHRDLCTQPGPGAPVTAAEQAAVLEQLRQGFGRLEEPHGHGGSPMMMTAAPPPPPQRQQQQQHGLYPVGERVRYQSYVGVRVEARRPGGSGSWAEPPLYTLKVQGLPPFEQVPEDQISAW